MSAHAQQPDRIAASGRARPDVRRRGVLRAGAGLLAVALAGMPAAADPIADPRAAEAQRLALLAQRLAAAVEAEFRRAEAALLTAAAALDPGLLPGAPQAIPFALLDRMVRSAAASLGLPVAAFNPVLAQLVNSDVPAGTPLPASPAAELAADALAAMRPVAGPLGAGEAGLGLAVPVPRSGGGRAAAALVARLPASHLSARLAAVLGEEAPEASARLVLAGAEGAPAETLAWIRAGAAPGPLLVLPEGPAALLELEAAPSEPGGAAPALLLAVQRLPRTPRGAVLVAAPVPAAAPPVPLAEAAAPAAGPAAGSGDGARLAAVALGAAGLGALLAGFAARRRLRAAAAVLPRVAALAAAERETRQALTDLKAICDTVPVGLALLDAGGRLLSANLRLAAFAGLPAEALVGRLAGDVLPPPLAEAIEAGRAQVQREGRPVLDAPLAVEAPGVLRHTRNLLVSCHPVRDAAGRVEAVSATVQDVTERARAEAGRDLLVKELNHRVKNCLATVQTIARQTMRNAADPASFERDFGERLRTLARAHDLLTAHAWGDTDLREVVQAALAPWLDDRRIVTEPGPEVPLRPTQAQALVLALHELATNAAKYGALTRDEGRVRLGWSIDREGMAQLRWVESGGPSVAPQPARRGFGTRLLEQALRQDLGSGAMPEIVFDPAGLRASIRFRPGGLLVPRVAA